MENYTLNIPKNCMLCDQVICRSVTVKSMLMQSTPEYTNHLDEYCTAVYCETYSYLWNVFTGEHFWKPTQNS